MAELRSVAEQRVVAQGIARFVQAYSVHAGVHSTPYEIVGAVAYREAIHADVTRLVTQLAWTYVSCPNAGATAAHVGRCAEEAVIAGRDVVCDRADIEETDIRRA